MATARRKLLVRNTQFKDLAAINRILNKTYPGLEGYPAKALQAQLNHFAEGQFVVEYEGLVVGFCMTFIISGRKALKAHTWEDITNDGYVSQHDPTADYLYGMEVCVDSDYRGKKIGARLYDERKKLCQRLGLRGIIFGARLPGFSKRQKQYPTMEAYLEAVSTKRIRDATVSFQMRNGFEPVKILPNYLPSDKESLGYAVLMKWENPLVDKQGKTEVLYHEDAKDIVRVCTLNFRQRNIRSFEDFKEIIEYFIEAAADYHCDFLLFPEFITMGFLAMENARKSPVRALEQLGTYTERYEQLMSEAAVRFNINIIGGTHIIKDEDGHMQNLCYVFLRDGMVYRQAKLHPTPDEAEWWDIQGGNKLSVINTDRVPIGVLVGYDIAFPEPARHLVDQGAKILFVPFQTDTRQAYLGLRVCAQARAIENQCYVALSGNIGNLPRVRNMDINYAQSCILTPSDFAFDRDGVAADTSPDAEMVAIADLSISDLVKARNNGTVRNLKDRRHDLYRVHWKRNH